MSLFKFNEYLTEERNLQQYDSKIEDIREVIDLLNVYLSLGLIDDSGYAEKYREFSNVFKKLVKGIKLNLRDKEDRDILLALSERVRIITLQGLKTEGANALFAKGLHLVSSPDQLLNGTLIFSLDPNYRIKDGWGIGFFPEVKRIRRITPKHIPLGIRGRFIGSMNIDIKQFPETNSKLDFYNTAMLWAADHIDFEHVINNPEITVWKYNVKKSKPQSYKRTEEQALRIEINELEAKASVLSFDTVDDVNKKYDMLIKRANLIVQLLKLNPNTTHETTLDYYAKDIIRLTKEKENRLNSITKKNWDFAKNYISDEESIK